MGSSRLGEIARLHLLPLYFAASLRCQFHCIWSILPGDCIVGLQPGLPAYRLACCPTGQYSHQAGLSVVRLVVCTTKYLDALIISPASQTTRRMPQFLASSYPHGFSTICWSRANSPPPKKATLNMVLFLLLRALFHSLQESRPLPKLVQKDSALSRLYTKTQLGWMRVSALKRNFLQNFANVNTKTL